MNLRYVIGGLFVLLVFVVGGLYVWNTFLHKSAEPVVPPPVTQPVDVMRTYASTTLGISVQYPPSYIINDSYTYNQFGPNKLIHGVSFTIPGTMASGTNLAPDTNVSVEWLPRAHECTGDIFLQANVKPQTIFDSGVTYSVASSSDAAAGNRYEEVVYAVASSTPCTAVRYFIHSSVLDNYPPGAVQAFDENALLADFDKIRRSVVVQIGQ